MTTLQTREPTQRARVGSRHHTTTAARLNTLLHILSALAAAIIAATVVIATHDVIDLITALTLVSLLLPTHPRPLRERPRKTKRKQRERDDVPDYMPGGGLR